MTANAPARLDLETFSASEPGVFLVPVERLGATGPDAAAAEHLERELGRSRAWVERLGRAFAAYQERLRDLFARAPHRWFPPRLHNLAFVTDRGRAHPYVRPLGKSSWLFDVEDFDPEASSFELSTYLLFHAERLNLTEDPGQAITHNLAYFLTLDAEQLEDLRAGCEATRRPEAASFRALAAALSWIGRLRQTELAPPRTTPLEPLLELEGTGLLVPRSLQEDVTALSRTFAEGAARVVAESQERAAAVAAGADPAGEVCAWVREEVPEVLLLHGEDGVVWDPERPEDTERLHAALTGLGSEPAESLRRDLALVHARTRGFLDALRAPEELPASAGAVDQDGGTYLYAGRRAIAYDLAGQSVWQPLLEPCPPYQRLLLGARVVHEWGHLAHDAGLVRVPPEREAEHAAALRELEAVYEQVVAAFPQPFQELTARELPELAKTERPTSAGAALAAATVRRIPDWAANRINHAFARPEEVEAYVRINVRTHVGERMTPARMLTRYAIEYQYLRLSGVEDRLGYFLALSGVGPLFFDTGTTTRALLEAVLAATGRVCDAYRIDRDRFAALPEHARAEDLPTAP